MSYLYSQTNRLEKPHNYMYTQFEGEALLESYQSNRMAVISRRGVLNHNKTEPDNLFVEYALPTFEKLFKAISGEVVKKFNKLLGSCDIKTSKLSSAENPHLYLFAKGLKEFTVTDSITTSELLHALIAVQLTDVQNENQKVWIDRLIQRYEVTKKIYDFYPFGFRKGEGASTSVRLYWLFALALSLFYRSTNEIKYLSTLLKLCDLLCSLPEGVVQGQIPLHGLPVVLAVEIVSVQQLAEKKRVLYATK